MAAKKTNQSKDIENIITQVNDHEKRIITLENGKGFTLYGNPTSWQALYSLLQEANARAEKAEKRVKEVEKSTADTLHWRDFYQKRYTEALDQSNVLQRKLSEAERTASLAGYRNAAPTITVATPTPPGCYYSGFEVLGAAVVGAIIGTLAGGIFL